jgi:hypothetical protein
MSRERDRVVCVPLSQAEWEAFTARHPEPVDWLRQQILAQIDEGALPKPQELLPKTPSPFSTRRV